MRRCVLVAMLAVALAVAARGQNNHCTDKGKESAHVAGPHGLEGWTLDSTIPGYSDPQACFSFTLVLARNGHVIRRRQAEPIVWKWIFWNNGRQVAIEEGPLHFGLNCVLEDVKTGRALANYDCYHYEPKEVPDWVQALEQVKRVQ